MHRHPWMSNSITPSPSGVKHRARGPAHVSRKSPAFVEAIEDQLSVIKHLEADLESKLKSAQALRQSILRHAFSGQLVLQAPKDEPAGELIKRIATERAERASIVGKRVGQFNRANAAQPSKNAVRKRHVKVR